MENIMELQQIVYSVLKTQISFGVYRFGEQLPTMDEACRLFGVSIKTIRAAYQQLPAGRTDQNIKKHRRQGNI